MSATINFFSYWFITNKFLEKIDNRDVDDRDSDIVTFCSNGMGLAAIGLNNANLDDDNFYEVDSVNFVLVTLIVSRDRFKHRKACKKIQNKQSKTKR